MSVRLRVACAIDQLHMRSQQISDTLTWRDDRVQISWRRRGMIVDVRESFVGEVRPQRTTTLKQLMSSLKRWITKLHEICEAKFPAVSHLEEEFPILANLDFVDMELPGQYQQMEYNPDSVVYVERLAADVLALRRHCISMRRIAFVCSDGRSRHFSVHTGQAQGSMGNTDQRMMMAFRCAAALPVLERTCKLA